jgi:hypothetical protein
MKSYTVFTLVVGLVLTIVIFGSFAEAPYSYSNNQFSVGIKKASIQLEGYDPWNIMAKPTTTEGSLLNYLAYSWYTSNPSSGGTAISSFDLALSGISANGQYVKASSGAVLNTANVAVQIYSKPYNNSAWQQDGTQNWTDVSIPFSTSWTSPSYSLTSLNQSSSSAPSVSGAILEIPITISNTQSAATPAPFQQLISINPSLYTGDEATNLGNIRFYTSSGTELYAWLESYSGEPSGGNANQATNANIYVKLPNGIAANSKVTIYMVFLSTSTNFDGNYWGEAPTLSPTYAEYDNGGNVFTYYQRFGGLSSLPSGWAQYNGPNIIYNTNNIEVQDYDLPANAEAGWYGIYYNIPSSLQTTGLVWDIYGNFTQSISEYPTMFVGVSSQNANYPSNGGYGFAINKIPGAVSDAAYDYVDYDSTSITVYPGNNLYSIDLVSSSEYILSVNISDTYTATGFGGYTTNPPYKIFFIEPYSEANAPYPASMYLYWVDVRAAPPNGVMPTAVVGSTGSNQQYDFAIKLTVNGVNAITGSPMSASTWLNLSSNLYWQGNIFKADIFSVAGMTPTLTLPMFAIELLIMLWIGIIIVAKRTNGEND